jgi:hypothetical protein
MEAGDSREGAVWVRAEVRASSVRLSLAVLATNNSV